MRSSQELSKRSVEPDTQGGAPSGPDTEILGGSVNSKANFSLLQISSHLHPPKEYAEGRQTTTCQVW